MSNHVCNRCGARIKHVFRVGGLTFGSECIQKINATDVVAELGIELSLASAVLAWGSNLARTRGQKHRLVALTSELVEVVPAIGKTLKHTRRAGTFKVQAFTPKGIRLGAFAAGMSWVEFAPYDFQEAGFVLA